MHHCRCYSLASAIVLLASFPPASAQTIVSSLAELRAHATDDNATIVMAAGEYWVNKNGSDRTLLRLAGDNTTYDFSQATFKVDTRNFDGFGGGGVNDVIGIGMYGIGSTVTGLNLTGVDVDVSTDPAIGAGPTPPTTLSGAIASAPPLR